MHREAAPSRTITLTAATSQQAGKSRYLSHQGRGVTWLPAIERGKQGDNHPNQNIKDS